MIIFRKIFPHFFLGGGARPLSSSPTVLRLCKWTTDQCISHYYRPNVVCPVRNYSAPVVPRQWNFSGAATTVVQVLPDLFYVLLHVLFYLRSLLYVDSQRTVLSWGQQPSTRQVKPARVILTTLPANLWAQRGSTNPNLTNGSYAVLVSTPPNPNDNRVILNARAYFCSLTESPRWSRLYKELFADDYSLHSNTLAHMTFTFV